MHFFTNPKLGGAMNFSNLRTKAAAGLTAMFVALLFATAAFAQSGTSGVNGTVTDQTGAVVAGATVTLTNTEKGFSRSVVTGDAGDYSFASILPDTYTIEVQAAGFKKAVQTDIRALIDNPIKVNIGLEVGDVGEIVTVTASSIDSIVNTQDASIGNNFQPQQIQQLPTDQRNITNLLSLQPGVTREGYVNGGRSDQANITLDGIDVNDQQGGGATNMTPGLSSVLRITAESIEEFRVTTSNPNAGQGRSSGAQISLSSKSGTNDFRGAVFYFKRPDFGSANSFVNNRAGVEKEGINRDIFGGAIGGPIVKDKFFFFYSYEGQRQRTETSVIRTVPLASLGNGIFNFFGTTPDEDPNTTPPHLISLDLAQLNSIYSAAGINPISLAVLAGAASRYSANDLVSGAGDNLNTGGFRFNAPTPEDQNTHIARFDYNINDDHLLFARFNKQNDVTGFSSNFPDTLPRETWAHNTGMAVGHNWAIGSNKVNSFRYGLTRQAFTAGGDANENAISFRFVFSPLLYQYSLSRVTPVHNFTDDFSWTIGRHNIQFGGNVRVIRNKREDSGAAYDTAVTNPSFYDSSGRSVFDPLLDEGYNNIATGAILSQAAITALIGRYSQYSASYNYDIDGNILPLGEKIIRNFATEEYDAYIQDSWKINQNLTLNFGLRYALSRPVYEQDGFQVRPNIPLGEYFQSRLDGAARGIPYNELLNFELAGPSYDAPGFYSLDKNNFQPRISAAWSPNFKSGFLGKFFGKDNESVFRGGFAITNDYFGQQLAVTFNALSTLGFTTSDNIAANTFNVTDNLAPRFTGFGQTVNTLPMMSAPDRFRTPPDEDQRIESSLDSSLVSPINYNWSFTYGRKLPKGLYIEASYVGRKARNLFVERDIMALNNLVDTQSGMDWYTAAGQIHDLFYAGADVSAVGPIPYFENLFPELAGFFDPAHSATQSVYLVNENFAGGDWTFLQLLLDDSAVFGIPDAWSNLFYQPQYAAFSAYSTVGKSDYHGGSLSVRQRFGDDLSFDFNYTLAKSLDDSSGLQNSGGFGSAFLLNPIRQHDSYAASDFDVRHTINANAIWQLPFGRDRRFFSDVNSVADTFLGGWQIAGVFRWNSGLPFSTPTDLNGWATNWNVRSGTVRTRPLEASPTRSGSGGANAFSNLQDLASSIRVARPGETGERNVFRGSGFTVTDLNLSKSFRMPWSENHKLQFRWEVFNVFNQQALDEGSISTFSFSQGIPAYGTNSELTPGTGEYSDIKGIPRRMQFGLRYSF